jgi:hypothetical protein
VKPFSNHTHFDRYLCSQRIRATKDQTVAQRHQHQHHQPHRRKRVFSACFRSIAVVEFYPVLGP